MEGVMSDGRKPRLQFRADPETKARIEEIASATHLSKSDVIRDFLEIGIAVSGDDIEQLAQARADELEVIQRNQNAIQLFPSHWRSHVKDQMAKTIKNSFHPDEIESFAAMLREQAEKKEEQAELIDVVPDADLVGIVDDVLFDALEAADLSTYYEDVDNPYAKRFEGVDDGLQQRDELILRLQSTVEKHQQLANALSNGSVPSVMPNDIDTDVVELLPEDKTREDFARLATECVKAGIDADAIPEHLDRTTEDFTLESDTGGELSPSQDDVEDDLDLDPGSEATIRMGGQRQNERWRTDDEDDEEQHDDSDSNPDAAEAVEAIQQQIADKIPAADGGRDDRTAGRGYGDTDMNPTTRTTDDSTDLELTDATEDGQEDDCDD
jgi:predicted transcriptional regulator